MSFKNEINEQFNTLESIIKLELSKSIVTRNNICLPNINIKVKQQVQNWSNKGKNNTGLNNLSEFRPDISEDIKKVLEGINLRDINLKDPTKTPYILFGIIVGMFIFLISKLIFGGWIRVLLITGVSGLLLNGGLTKEWKKAKIRFNRITLNSYLRQLEKYKNELFSIIDNM
ncbi:hypothetical protein PV797_03880 [Clostridiaceae bacterium M8S5]|nr:hypothetical protein PV797_03880 [Clostridiaceae bacterium M8S5]